MKRQFSSVDLHYIAKELEVLKNARIDKVYHPEKNVLVLEFHKANEGKKILKIAVGKSLFLVDEKEKYEETLGFGMLLRKHLEGCFLEEVEQLRPERILKLTFKVKDSVKYLHIELLGKGNIILCDERNIIINAIEHHDFKDRSIRPKLKYAYPVMSYNFFDLKQTSLQGLFKNSKKESVIVSLATELGLGGLYAEESCLLAGIDKNSKPTGIDEGQTGLILNSISKILNKKINAMAFFDSGSLVDFAPFELEFYKDKEKKEFGSFSSVISFFYSNFEEKKESEFEKKIKSLQRIIEEQELHISCLKEDEKELRAKGELIYQNYNIIKEILDELNKASKKYSWKEIKEKLKGHKTIKELNEKDRKVVVEI